MFPRFLVYLAGIASCVYSDEGKLKVALKANRDILKPSADSLQPQQIHLSFGASVTDIVVMWATRAKDKSFVEYHTGDRQKALSVEGESVQLETDIGGQWIHRVLLQNLKPEQKYYYHVRGEIVDYQSDQFSFTVPATLAGKLHTFMVYSDMGTETKSLKFLMQEALNDKYEAIFHVGNLAFDLHGNKGQTGDTFLKQIEKCAARIPYMTAPGDHESFENFQHYRHRFSMPSLPWPMQSEKLWYSIDIGPVHFIVYSTEVFFSDEINIEPMLEWLQDDLEDANSRRSAQPWIIAMGHRPMYCSIDDVQEDCTRPKSLVRTYLEELFFRGGVDLIISGHQHYYERTWPAYKHNALQYNYIRPKAPVHVTIGTLGAVYTGHHQTKVESQWSAKIVAETEKESFGKLKVFNATHLSWEVLESANNRLVDKMWIIQPFHSPFGQQSVHFPNPLGGLGEKWMQDNREKSFGLESFLGLSGGHYGDDYQTKLTVLIFVFIFLVIFLIARKKVLNLIRIYCMRKEPCKKVSATLNGNNGVSV